MIVTAGGSRMSVDWREKPVCFLLLFVLLLTNNSGTMRPCSVSHLLLNYTALAIDLLSDAEPPVVNVQLVNVEQYTIIYQDEDDQFTSENLV